MKFRSVLIAIDIQAPQNQTANILATVEHLSSVIQELHIVTVPRDGLEGYRASGNATCDQKSVPFDQSLVGSQLDLLRDISSDRLPDANLHTVNGQPALEVAKLATQLKAELTIMGTHSRHGLARLSASASQRVLQRLPSDLLLVRGSMGSRYERVLVALDKDETGVKILERVSKLNFEANQCSVISVVPEISGFPAVVPSGTLRGYKPVDIQRKLTTETRVALEETLDSAGLSEAALAITYGEPVESIVAKANEINADLVIIGSNNHGSIHRKLLGSTTSGVLNEVNCDVFVVKNNAE